MANEYATLADLKASVEPSISDLEDDVNLSRLLTIASRSIDLECDRYFYSTSDPIYLRGDGTARLNVSPGILTLTEVAVDVDGDSGYSDVWETTEYRLEPTLTTGAAVYPASSVRALDGRYFPADAETLVRLTGTFGWAAVPEVIQQATLMLAIRLWKRASSPLGVSGFGDMGPVYVRSKDEDIARLISPMKRWSVG